MEVFFKLQNYKVALGGLGSSLECLVARSGSDQMPQRLQCTASKCRTVGCWLVGLFEWSAGAQRVAMSSHAQVRGFCVPSDHLSDKSTASSDWHCCKSPVLKSKTNSMGSL